MQAQYQLFAEFVCDVCGHRERHELPPELASRKGARHYIRSLGWVYYWSGHPNSYVSRCPAHAVYDTHAKEYRPRPTDLRRAA